MLCYSGWHKLYEAQIKQHSSLTGAFKSWINFKSWFCEMEDYAVEFSVNQRFETIRPLGEGSYGGVWKVRARGSGEASAMKVVERTAHDHSTMEIMCLQTLKHKHLTSMAESSSSCLRVWIFMECYDGGNLMQYRRNRKNYSEVAAARHIKQVLSAVDYMHSCNVAHRDLKMENMLLASMLEDADLKIADFGLAVVFATDSCTRCMKRITSIKESFVGSPFCMAPEVAIRDAAYGPQCDIWSIGCIAYELLDGRPPFRGKSVTGIYKAIHTSLGPSFDKQVWTRHSHEARDFCGHMLQKLPEDRYDAQEALEDVWISSAE